VIAGTVVRELLAKFGRQTFKLQAVQRCELVMKKFIQVIALVLASGVGAEMVSIVHSQPAMAGNIPVMNIEVHPAMPCVGHRC
jgi:uncharacterized protein with ACT and thioredoxin-like domain